MKIINSSKDVDSTALLTLEMYGGKHSFVIELGPDDSIFKMIKKIHEAFEEE